MTKANKAIGGGVGGGAGVAVSEIVIWLISLTGVMVPSNVETAISVLVIAGTAYLVAYKAPKNSE